MNFTPELALALVQLVEKICTNIAAGDPIDVESEIAALEAARMKTSQEIMNDADKASKEG